MFSQSTESILAELERLETELVQVYSELPEDWLMKSDIVEHLTAIDQQLEKDTGSLDGTHNSAILEHIDRQYGKVLVLLKKIARSFGKTLKNPGDEPPTHIQNQMRLLADALHKLNFYTHQYPVHLIHSRKIYASILKGLREGLFVPADLDYDAARHMIGHFIGSQLILALQFNTNERPYLFITLDGRKVERHIVKKSHYGKDLIISKLMALLGIRHMEISYKHKLNGDKVEDLCHIKYIKGVRLESLGRLKGRHEILTFAYLLGAATSDGFALNLSDRPFNLHVDLSRLRKAKAELNYIGRNNPIFNLDYEFHTICNPKEYLESQVFSSRGLIVELFMTHCDLMKARLSKEDVIASFNKGFSDEIHSILYNYRKNQKAVDRILHLNNITYLANRFSPSALAILSSLETRYVPKLPVEEYHAA